MPVEFYSIPISLSHHQCLTGANGPLAASARPCQPAPQVSGTGAADAPIFTHPAEMVADRGHSGLISQRLVIRCRMMSPG